MLNYFFYRSISSQWSTFCLAVVLSCGCEQGHHPAEPHFNMQKIMLPKPTAADHDHTPSLSPLELQCIDSGLVDVQTIDTSIRVNLKYSTDDNFLCTDLYGEFNKCYLQADVAHKLCCAQEELKRKFPYYSLIVYDAVRPRSVQALMWDTIRVARTERSRYVSNPRNGSLHNFGAAVDIGIIDENGIELDMGTPYDYFGELAYPREEMRMITEKKLSYRQLFNRKILRETMMAAGFSGITTEWWHFNSCSRNEAFEKYRILE